jgi:hypothetical protein
MVPEGVPSQLVHRAVVLVQIIPRMSEDQVWRYRAFQSLKDFLNFCPDIRKEGVPELVHVHLYIRGTAKQRFGTLTGFLGSVPFTPKYHPTDRERPLGRKPDDRTTTADLEIIRMGAETKDRKRWTRGSDIQMQHASGCVPVQVACAHTTDSKIVRHCLSSELLLL